jgi:ComF family protein
MTLSVNQLAGVTREWSEKLVALLFPARCVSCHRIGASLCLACSSTLHPITTLTCYRCGYPLPAGDSLCPNCPSPPLSTTRTQSVFWHEGAIREAIHALKYNRRRDVAIPLAKYLASNLPDHSMIDIVTAVPLHVSRQRERGYNQAELLARRVALLTRLPYATVLSRTRATAQQVGLDRSQRRTNVANAFTADASHVRGKIVLLIDDVSTTGATLDACASALFQAGARAVYGLTVTRPRGIDFSSLQV